MPPFRYRGFNGEGHLTENPTLIWASIRYEVFNKEWAAIKWIIYGICIQTFSPSVCPATFAS